MTTAWRICRRPFADLSGEGARLYGGRWNFPGRPVVYAAEAAALAVLEVRVHLDLDGSLLPADYVLMAIDLNSLAIESLEEAPDDPVAYGDAWLESRRSAVLRRPLRPRPREPQSSRQRRSPRGQQSVDRLDPILLLR